MGRSVDAVLDVRMETRLDALEVIDVERVPETDRSIGFVERPRAD